MPGRSAQTKRQIKELRTFLVPILLAPPDKTQNAKETWLSAHVTTLYNQGNRAHSCVLGGLPATLGLEVEFHGLVTNTSLNGQRGVLKSFEIDAQRWEVTLQDGKDVKGKPTNLRATQETPLPIMVEKPKQTAGAERKDGQNVYVRIHRQRLFDEAAREDPNRDKAAIKARAQQMANQEFCALPYSCQVELATFEVGAPKRNALTGAFEQDLLGCDENGKDEELKHVGKPFCQLAEGRQGGCRRDRCSALRAAVDICAGREATVDDVAKSVDAVLKDSEKVALHRILGTCKPVLEACSKAVVVAAVGEELIRECNNISPASSNDLPKILLSRAVKTAAPSCNRKQANKLLGTSLGRVCWDGRCREKAKRGRPCGTYKKPSSIIHNHLKANSHASSRVSASGEVACTLDKSKTRLGRQLGIPKSTFCRRTAWPT